MRKHYKKSRLTNLIYSMQDAMDNCVNNISTKFQHAIDWFDNKMDEWDLTTHEHVS